MSNALTDLEVDAEELNTLLLALADERARQVVTTCRETDQTTVAFEDLVRDAAVQASPPNDRERAAIGLYHTSLPRLAAAGVIEYGPSSGAVEYLDHPALGGLIEMVAETGASA